MAMSKQRQINEQEPAGQQVTLHAENIGGITRTDVEIGPGPTILAGRNATNRTSLLQAFMSALGSDRTPLKADAEEGYVELMIGDRTYDRTVSRRDGTLVTDGNPYLDDPTGADLFAFLLESNEARRAVARAENLRDIIMRPIDTERIEAQVESLRSEREQIERRIENVESLKHELTELERKKSALEQKKEEKREQLAEIEEEIEKRDEEVNENAGNEEQLENRLGDLRNVRSQLERVRNRIETEKESISALERERESVEDELSGLDPISEAELNELDDEIDHLRSRRSDIDESVDELQTVIRFNQKLLEDDRDFFDRLEGDNEAKAGADVTEELLNSQELTCWTCGSEIAAEQVENMLERFQNVHSEYMSERSELDDQIGNLRKEQSKLEEQQRQREQLQSRSTRIDTELENSRAELAQLKNRRDDLVSEVETLESDVEDLRSTEDHSELIGLHKEANEVEVEIDQIETELADVTGEIDQFEAEITDLERLRNERDEIQAEMENLRNRVDRIEQAAVDSFNEEMETVLGILEYENLDKVWLERTERQERDGRQKVTTPQFELHVIRSTDDGTVFEDHVSHLSESEREVTGLVFGLAGYLAHELYEDCPFVLIDSVEAIDAPRIATLVDYLKQYADYLIVALLKQDAQALNETYERITDV
jgi:predicted  nucleic acid-binding Zn-ribbon protein